MNGCVNKALVVGVCQQITEGENMSEGVTRKSAIAKQLRQLDDQEVDLKRKW